MLAASDMLHRAWRAMPDTLGIRLSRGDFTSPRHVQLISWLLMLNAYGYVPRLGVSQPPGTGKSELIDYWNPIWLLEQIDRRRVVLASYAGSLAEEQGKRVRNTIETNSDVLRVRIMQDSRAADRWRTTGGGGMWTVGIGGTLTGRRASNMLIDDPHKNFAEAMSEKSQIDTWNWYTSTARTRLLAGRPQASVTTRRLTGGAIGVIQTRWAEGDLIGRLRERDAGKNQWLFVALPAIAEEDETIRTVIGDHWCNVLESKGVELFDWRRDQGAALWPELEPGVPWFDEAEYESIRLEVGEMVWAGLYQQRPAPMEGTLFKRSDWVRVDVVPAGPMTYVRRWDLASSGDPQADATASCLMGYHHPSKMLYILDMTRDRLPPHEVERLVRQTAEQDKDRYGNVYIRIEKEPGSSGGGVESNYKRSVLPKFAVEFIPSSGPKEVRALPVAGRVQGHHVHLVRQATDSEYITPKWFEWLIEEAAAFPNAKHDDMVDVVSLAYVDLLDLAPRRSKARVKSTARRTLGF